MCPSLLTTKNRFTRHPMFIDFNGLKDKRIEKSLSSSSQFPVIGLCYYFPPIPNPFCRHQMAKAVVYTLLATAFIILFTFSTNKRHSRTRLGQSRRLGYKASHFDPLVSRIERSAEEKGLSYRTDLEHISYVPEVADAPEYFDDEGSLNTTLRLLILFPLLDNAPKDGLISAKELGGWIEQQAIDRLSYGTDKLMAWHDQNGDGAISFREYLPQFTEVDLDKNGKGHGEAGWWMEQFNNADADKNGNLDFNEFKDFLHPEDSDNEQIQKWLLKEKMKRMDDDHDGKLNFKEFVEHAYNIYKSYAEFENAAALAPTAEDKFVELDINKDKYLVVEELRPILRYLNPGELFYAKHFTDYLVYEADDNKDGNLTVEEMLNHGDIFYNTLYDDSLDDFDDIHDEL